jgi:hypothetical protein
VQIVLEHLTISAIDGNRADLLIERALLPDGADPVEAGFSHHSEAMSHSTSWRAEPGRVVLTFVHVLPDGSELSTPAGGETSVWSGTPEELEALPSACHAVRHLHFLRFTDEDIAASEDLSGFWAFAHSVADHHYPAVAGLLFAHGLADGPDFVI